MKLTRPQFRWLKWLADHGGAGIVKGQYVWDRQGVEHTNQGACLSFLFLVQLGAILAVHGELHITEYGRRLLAPFKS